MDSNLVGLITQVPTPNYTGTKRNWELNSDYAPRTRGPMSLEAPSLTHILKMHLTVFFGLPRMQVEPQRLNFDDVAVPNDFAGQVPPTMC